MHKITLYENIRDKIDAEITDIDKTGINSKDSLDNLYKLTMSLKAIDKHLECLEMAREMDEEEDGHSNAYPYSYRSRRYYPYSYGDPAWGDVHSMNRPMWNGDNAPRGMASMDYSRDDAKRKMVQKLQSLKDDTMSDGERKAIQECIDRIGAMA